MSQFTESEERRELRKAVASLGAKYGEKYFHEAAAEGRKTTELWAEAGRLGYLGVSIPEEFGGGGGDIGDLAAVCEELATAGCPLLLMVVSPAIVGTTIAQYGTQEQKERWLPGLADGTATYAFSITEPDAGSNSHNIVTHAEKAEDGSWVLNGTKTYISGVDEASHLLVVARYSDARTGKLKPALFMVPTDADGFTKQQIEMGVVSPEKQFTLFFDDVRVAADALVGQEDAGLEQLFAGLNPERIMAASMATGTARWAIRKAVAYAKEREAFGKPIGKFQHNRFVLAEMATEAYVARTFINDCVMKLNAGQADPALASMAKWWTTELQAKVVDAGVQLHGGYGYMTEYPISRAYTDSRISRIYGGTTEIQKEIIGRTLGF